MRVDVKGRNLSVSDEIKAHVEKRFRAVSRQVSDLAELEVELIVERNPANPDCYVAEVTLHLKGVTLRARDASPELKHSINLASEEITRQVKRHRVKRRKRREARSASLDGAAIADTAADDVADDAADDAGDDAADAA